MKILWVSDTPFESTAYGQQTLLTAPLLQSLGHEVVVYAPALHGRSLSFDGVKILGGRLDLLGNDLIIARADFEDVDLVITMKDPYCFDPGIMRKLSKPWLPVVPVDSEPLCRLNDQALSHCTQPIAITKSGASALVRAGYDPVYIPHGINLSEFRPGPKEAARKILDLPADAFIALFVGANQTDNPPRKNIEPMIAAWPRFVDHHPDAILYLHTDLTGDRGGVDIDEMTEAYNIQSVNLRATNPYLYNDGVAPHYLILLYQAADVLISIGNEGFGLPALESQACGTPVVGLDWAAGRELIGSGVRIQAKDGVTGERRWSPTGGWWFRPYVAAIEQALELVFERRHAPELGAGARAFAMQYDINHVVQTYWKPALEHWEQWLIGGYIHKESQHE